MSRRCQARVRALAKINLNLRVLGKRPDGYHELRTIFQTISLADNLEIAFTPGRRTGIELADAQNIPDNLVLRAARLVMDVMRITGRVEMRLVKRIPMGAGLGGGSSDAAAVLLALPVLAGRAPGLETLLAAQQLGSDVAFFLLGGCAAGIGRGSELFPLPDGRPQAGVLVAPGIHVSTKEAYQRISPGLTSESQQNKIFSFQSQLWGSGVWETAANDFEGVVFGQHHRLAALKRKLIRAGASMAMMTGSGSAVFGLFPTAEAASQALGWDLPDGERIFPISLVSRARYRSMWWRALQGHIEGRAWPPRSRDAR